jgi:uncharacterized protein YktB (UPF0637 family)
MEKQVYTNEIHINNKNIVRLIADKEYVLDQGKEGLTYEVDELKDELAIEKEKNNSIEEFIEVSNENIELKVKRSLLKDDMGLEEINEVLRELGDTVEELKS